MPQAGPDNASMLEWIDTPIPHPPGHPNEPTLRIWRPHRTGICGLVQV